jgi:secreted PhoX family phosphatase
MKTKKTLMVLMSVAAATALFMSGCGSDDGEAGAAGITGINGVDGTDAGKLASKLQFEEIPVPVTDSEKKAINASPKATNLVNGFENSVGFTKLMATADTDNGEIYGLVKDFQDQPLTFADGSPYICNGTNAGVGSGLDYVSFLNDPEGNGKMYMVSQFECEIGAMYINELEQDAAGKLTPKSGTLKFVSQKDFHGGWVHCAGMKTPWESHLGSEEYETNARMVEEERNATTGLTGDEYFDELAKFFGGDANKSNAYFWGWTPEVKVVGGEAQYTKHYAMGRMSHELSYVMPDSKTVYMTDDGTNDAIFMYIADASEDLSAGTLYAAKWTQTSAIETDGGSADITWINLGHATDAEVKVAVDDNITFSDLFNTDTVLADDTCNAGFTFINTENGKECLQLNTATYSEAVISRLESRRYAAMMGATTEFRKMEGFTYDADHGKAYISISAIEKGMLNDDAKYDAGGNNDIKLKYNKCGAVYAMDVAAGTVNDTGSAPIDSQYVVTNMYAVVKGMPYTYPAGHQYEGNTCSVEGISMPDNVTFLAGSNILAIGEDSDKHVNNMIWAYDVKTGALVRMVTVPEKAETTSPFWYKDLNGFGYMSAVAQHPNKDSDKSNFLPEEESFVGYYGPFIDLP